MARYVHLVLIFVAFLLTNKVYCNLMYFRFNTDLIAVAEKGWYE